MAQTIRLLSVTQERLCLALPNLVTLSFVYWAYFGRIVAKLIRQEGNLLQFFKMSHTSRRTEKYEFLSCLKTREMHGGRGINFEP